jgi:hypothetical protein
MDRYERHASALRNRTRRKAIIDSLYVQTICDSNQPFSAKQTQFLSYRAID